MPRLIALMVFVVCAIPCFAPSQVQAQNIEVKIDTTSARATLDALSNKGLARSEALRVAQLPGNAALIRKRASMDASVTEERFIEELLAQARGTKIEGESFFNFDEVSAESAGIARTLSSIESDRNGFIQAIRTRISPFSPKGQKMSLKGYLLIGGNSSGFAFGGSDFYLNLGHYPDQLETAKMVMAHELYHAVQGTAVNAAGLKSKRGFDDAQFATITDSEAKRAYLVEGFLYFLYQEGTAMYVGDPALMTGKGWMTEFEQSRLRTQLNRLDRLATHLDLSLIALTAEPSYDFKRAYAFGFYGPDQPLYYLGYAMSKEIVAKRGPAALAGMIETTGCGFMSEYLNLAATDADLPKIGDRTIELVQKYCGKN